MVSAANLTIDGRVITNMATYGVKAQHRAEVDPDEVRIAWQNTGLFANGGVTVTVDQSHIVQSVTDGVTIDGSATNQIAATDISLNGNNGVTVLASSGAVTTRAAVTNSRVSDNVARGIRVTSTQGIVYLTVADTLITASGITGHR